MHETVDVIKSEERLWNKEGNICQLRILLRISCRLRCMLQCSVYATPCLCANYFWTTSRLFTCLNALFIRQLILHFHSACQSAVQASHMC